MTTPHTSGAADLPEALDAIADSQYLAGVAAGWNAAQASDPNAALRKIHESRAGYLKPLRDAQLAALAAGQAVAPAEAMEVDNYPSLPKSTGDVVDWGIGSSSREVDWSDDAPPAGGKSLYTADQMRAYVDADRATRPAPPAMDGGEDAEELRLLRALAFSVERAIGNGVMPLEIEEAYEGYDKWSAARAAQKEKP